MHVFLHNLTKHQKLFQLFIVMFEGLLGLLLFSTKDGLLHILMITYKFVVYIYQRRNIRQHKYLKIFTTWFKLKFKFSKVIMEWNILITFWENIF